MGRPKGVEPPGVNVGTRVPQDLYDWFVAVAEAGDRTLSRQVFIAMREYRERHAANDVIVARADESTPRGLPAKRRRT